MKKLFGGLVAGAFMALTAVAAQADAVKFGVGPIACSSERRRRGSLKST
jgi:hypothetical protein